MADKTQVLSNMTTRQKVTAGVVVVVVLIVIWQVIGLFGGGSNKAVAVTPAPDANKTMTAKAAAPSMMSAANPSTATPAAASEMQPQQPQAAQLSSSTTGLTDREAALIKMQEETQAKYIAALNELQMLKVARDIAEANQAIMDAKLATVASEKKIVDMLSPQPATPATYAQNIEAGVGPPPQAPPVQGPNAPVPPVTASYTVISISELQHRWNAVLGYQGNLYNVHVGDVLPPDNSKVVGIDKAGVILERDGIRKRVTLVPII